MLRMASTRLLRSQHFRRAIAEYVAHYHPERSHQELGNRLIAGTPVIDMTSLVQRRPRLRGLLSLLTAGRRMDSAEFWNDTTLSVQLLVIAEDRRRGLPSPFPIDISAWNRSTESVFSADQCF